MEILSQTFGWAGMFLVLAAYFLVSTKRINATSHVYQLMNLFGAMGVGVNVFHQQAWPSFALQAVWGLIAIFSLFRITKKD